MVPKTASRSGRIERTKLSQLEQLRRAEEMKLEGEGEEGMRGDEYMLDDHRDANRIRTAIIHSIRPSSRRLVGQA